MKNQEASVASISGIPLLPTEILSKIFLQCTDIDGSLTPTNTINVPLLLTKICRPWRTIAIGTRSLWSRLYLSIDPNAKHQTSLVSTWLTRSGTCPLQIYIMWSDPPYFASHAILDILVEHSHRWWNMYFFLPLPAYSSLSPIRGNLPILAELSLGTHEPPITDPTLDAFEIAPKLRSLECVNLHPYMFKIPWSHLTHIPIMAVAVKDSIDILRRVPSLENASFIFTNETAWPVPRPTALRHEHLRELAVLAPTWNESIETRDLFKYLTAPKLHSLRICNITRPLATHLSPFLARVDALESLYLRKTALTESDVLAILELLPGLKYLTLLSSSEFTMATDVLLEQLTYNPEDKPLTPKLETLEISLPGALTIPFVELLESRWSLDVDNESSPITRLKRVNVGASDECEEDIMSRLEVLAQAGMTVIIGSTDVPLEDGLEYMSSRSRDDAL